MNANEKQPVAPGKQKETPEIHEPISNSMTISNEAAEAKNNPALRELLARYNDPQSETRRLILSAITRVCAERDRQLAVMKDALEEFAKETESVPCDDPQCGDSTWDHACTAGRRKPTKRAEKAIAALASSPAAATKEEQ